MHRRLVDAAKSLGVSESAVSHQIRGLEDLLHVKLFDRTAEGLRLTATGRAYLERIAPALAEIEAATQAVLPERGRASVRLTLPPSLAATWLVPRLRDFEIAHPDIDLQLMATTRLVDLARDHVDAAIRYGRGAWDGLEAELLFEDLATPVASPAFMEGRRPDPAELLSTARLIVNRSIPHEWTEWASARGLAPPRLDAALVLDSVEQVLAVAETGHGLAMGRWPYLDERLARGALVAPFGAAGPTGAAYFFCTPAGRAPTAAVRAVRRWLSAAAHDGGT